MIQRIQSVYLLLTSILTLLFLKLDFLKFFNSSGTEIIMNVKGIWESSGQGQVELIQRQIPLSVIVFLIPLVSLAALFLYRNRKLQLRLSSAVILLASVLTAYLIVFVILITGRYNVQLNSSIQLVIPPLILVLSLLAFRGIRKDENLVRSYDRLR